MRHNQSFHQWLSDYTFEIGPSLFERTSDETIRGTANSDNIYGGSGNDTIFGN